jgi:hypothetical protein
MVKLINRQNNLFRIVVMDLNPRADDTGIFALPANLKQARTAQDSIGVAADLAEDFFFFALCFTLTV